MREVVLVGACRTAVGKFGGSLTNVPAVAFGALGAPVTTLGAVTQLHDVTLGAMIGRQLPLIALILPFYVIGVFGGLRAIKGEGPEPGSNFNYGAKLTEIILLGVLAQRFNTRIEWDSKSGRITNHPELNAFVKEPAREGWQYGEAL